MGKHHRVFQEIPKWLPPSRDHEHQIELILGSNPPNKMPYRYHHQQKGEIENMVQDMLDLGIIQPRRCSFSASVVTVRRKDNAWRMCRDYIDLHKITINDKYLIPNIDELIDELHGVAYFTKLYLKSGYHQIRLREDIPKTTFRTHEGHYELLVIDLGSTNVLSTFQNLMNIIF